MLKYAYAPGDTFGRLTLVADAAPGARWAKWLTRCQCGAEKVIGLYNVLSGKTASCGCLRVERLREACSKDLTGQRIGMLTVIRPYGVKRSYRTWLCACDCGCGYIAMSMHLVRGQVKSCGCIMRGFSERPRSLFERRALGRKLASNHRRKARIAEVGGSFSASDIDALLIKQRCRCASCRCKLNGKFHRDHKIPIARGGSNDIGNIELLCEGCNCRKQAKDPVKWANENGRLL